MTPSEGHWSPNHKAVVVLDFNSKNVKLVLAEAKKCGVFSVPGESLDTLLTAAAVWKDGGRNTSHTVQVGWVEKCLKAFGIVSVESPESRKKNVKEIQKPLAQIICLTLAAGGISYTEEE